MMYWKEMLHSLELLSHIQKLNTLSTNNDVHMSMSLWVNVEMRAVISMIFIYNI